MLNEAGDLFSQELSRIGSAVRYWGLAEGDAVDEAVETVQTVTGADLKPYAPAHLAGVWGASGITLSWLRRTRLGGDWRDGLGSVPLLEAVEAYEVEILDAAGDVLRVLAGASEQVIYAEADAVADFGAVPAALDVRVCQLSAAVGRGFAARATLGP